LAWESPPPGAEAGEIGAAGHGGGVHRGGSVRDAAVDAVSHLHVMARQSEPAGEVTRGKRSEEEST
jgi:hypothetical protein